MVTWLYRCPNEDCDTYEKVDFEAFYQSVGRAESAPRPDCPCCSSPLEKMLNGAPGVLTGYAGSAGDTAREATSAGIASSTHPTVPVDASCEVIRKLLTE